ncbi:TetR/AcrR family transcriptional regulator [Paenibacillus sp. MBLB2552]|uniref:TetR/AcrR family transcriptional regulator n=1 Tax=Paenibacillus mellifer TaxID=2937794 RepID=A0A9X2BQX6_9BACL|nr:TetR/AcrR family transcriptional regulator [Paenibacillus mellifer]MCK8486680.1 TetR/AcrR family transcriptional regulator [Paenibacillus mellifer]
MGEIRNAERTRKLILESAREEFLMNGYAGTKIEAIARRAGIKKQLIYHYFKGKDHLLKETIEDFLSSVPSGNFILPANPADIAEYRLRINIAYLMDFLKYTAWEAVEAIPGEINGEDIRGQLLKSYNEDIRSKQEMGLVPKELEPSFVTLMLSSLTIYPLLYPNVTRMITGLDSTDPEFQEGWAAFLRDISKRIFNLS